MTGSRGLSLEIEQEGRMGDRVMTWLEAPGGKGIPRASLVCWFENHVKKE
jgi:hypothetical protein